ncbi:pirin family protein [Tepidamorphus sp. 3E244]|uniref:pirin family protein n=1 Tax=Tepidamorphus sp. 3E244 TaxID=3385498 RepID=UPI0038FC0A67
MSWQPCPDPLPGDKKASDLIETVIVPRARDLGGFSVRRALPSGKKQMVGPFIFFDQMGPAEFVLGEGIDVRPHPHIGLATLTYLFDGSIVHRDSLGTELTIEPGAVNLMTAGKGIVHSERTGTEPRKTGDSFGPAQLLVFNPGDDITVRAKSDARFVIVGGEPMDGPRYIWWNFVSSSKERIEQAKEDWRQARFDTVPGESEFIPLPTR